MASRYAIRSAALAAMGYSSYDEYLASELWKAIRERVIARDHGCCRACGKKAVSVHHITYAESIMRGDDDSQLVAVCRGCHKAAEFADGKKLTYTTDISFGLLKRVRGCRSKKKSVARTMWPKCRCCQKTMRKLGRNDICMGCYKSGRALKFVQAQLPNGSTIAPSGDGQQTLALPNDNR